MALKKLFDIIAPPIKDESDEKQQEAPLKSDNTRGIPTSIHNDVLNRTAEKLTDIKSQQKAPTDVNSQFIGNHTPIRASKPVTHLENCDTEVAKVMNEYKNHLQSMNKEGYDFYEFYEMIQSKGIDNLQMYQMILDIAVSSNKGTVSKETLISSGEYYINGMVKAHTDFQAMCNEQLKKVTEQRTSQSKRLKESIEIMEKQIKDLQIALADNIHNLNSLDAEFTPKIEEIQCMISANDGVKDSMVSSLSDVLNNLKQL